MKTLSLILARCGSKGIPDKNIIEINGNPLLYYTANASLNSNVNETWVSTDCDKIKKVAQNIGCILFRHRNDSSVNE
jgi:CMP-N-acetylneuraminic acid synthetase